jgi:hypothetical protein
VPAITERLAGEEHELFAEDQTFSEEELMVRFLFRKGTDEGTALDPFPLFGEQAFDIPYTEFVEKLPVRSINSLEQWCSTSASTETFRVAANQTAAASSASSGGGSGSGLSNAAAGGFCAAVTLAFVGAIGAAFWAMRRWKMAKQPVHRSQVIVDPEKNVRDSSGHSVRQKDPSREQHVGQAEERDALRSVERAMCRHAHIAELHEFHNV